jgi:anti-anti-sigma factor
MDRRTVTNLSREVIMHFAAPSQFTVHNHRSAKVHRLTPVGELDIATVAMLEAEFDAACTEDDGETIIVLDLRRLEFIDSTGIHLLLRMAQRCTDDQLRVIGGSPVVERLLEITGIGDSLPIIHENRDPTAPLPSHPPQGGAQS